VRPLTSGPPGLPTQHLPPGPARNHWLPPAPLSEPSRGPPAGLLGLFRPSCWAPFSWPVICTHVLLLGFRFGNPLGGLQGLFQASSSAQEPFQAPSGLSLRGDLLALSQGQFWTSLEAYSWAFFLGLFLGLLRGLFVPTASVSFRPFGRAISWESFWDSLRPSPRLSRVPFFVA